MKIKFKKMNNKGFLGLIGLLFAVAIIGFAAYFIFSKYLGKPTGMDQNIQEAASQSGIDTTSQASILESAKSTIKGIEAKQQSQSQELDNSLAQ